MADRDGCGALEGRRVGLIGAGAIGGAVIERLLAVGVEPAAIIACETREERRQEVAGRHAVRVTASPTDAGAADLVVLAMPPAAMAAVLDAIRGVVTGGRVVVSFAGGVPLAYIEGRLAPETPVIRVNPNSPSLVGAGFNPVSYGRHAIGAARRLADAFLAVLGESPAIADDRMNAYTALTAVGPTYFLPVFDALIALAMEVGLDRRTAVEAAVATARGTADLVAQRPEAPAQLKLITGLRPLEDAVVADLVRDAARAALARMEDVQRGFPPNP
jgi:pyrroline-5-carboxylate reductase